MMLENALMWYYIYWRGRLEIISKKELRVIGKELSSISAAIPLNYPLKEFSPGEVKKVVNNMQLKYFRAKSDNQLRITLDKIQIDMTPIKAHALMIYITDRLSGYKLKDKPKYSYLKTADILIREETKNLDRIAPEFGQVYTIKKKV